MKSYPDISSIIKQKEKHRRLLAALPFEQKIGIVFKLAERRKFIKSGEATGDVCKSKLKDRPRRG